MAHRSGRNDFESRYDEFPPYSRLFLVCNKAHGEDDFRQNFGKFGNIEDVRVVKDRNTGENKGVAYIKYSKTSEAAAAMEEMNGKRFKDSIRPMKVMVASSKTGGRDGMRDNDEDRYNRLFIMVPRSFNEDDVDKEFSKHGRVDNVVILKDRNTLENKGYAYIKFRSFLDTALAFENADKKYKAIFAEPKKSMSTRNNEDQYYPQPHHQYRGEPNRGHQIAYHGSVNHMIPQQNEGYTKLNVMGHASLTQEMVWKLFDLIPGMEIAVLQHRLDNIQGAYSKGTVMYTNPSSAAYAREKLNNFEYPTGHRLMVTPDMGHNPPMSTGHDLESLSNDIKSAMHVGAQSDYAILAETIAKASKILDAATGTFMTASDDSICSVTLPSPKPLANIDCPVAQRCFIVCSPKPPPPHILRNVFSRFGDLIDVYVLPYKTVGYVKYASTSAAKEAIKVLHGADICGIRMKVMEAEERNKPPSDRMRREPSNDEMNDSDNPNKRVKIANDED